jgi:hypothetical protein
MKKSIYAKTLAFLFVVSLFSFATTVQSCSKKPGYQTRNGGQKVKSSGHIGNRKHKNSHVWGQ